MYHTDRREGYVITFIDFVNKEFAYNSKAEVLPIYIQSLARCFAPRCGVKVQKGTNKSSSELEQLSH